MAVAFDARVAFGTSQNGVTTITDSRMTVGSGANRALIVGLISEYLPGNIPTPVATWDSAGANQAMTLLSTATDTRPSHSGSIFIFGLVAPASGNKTLSISGMLTTDDSLVAMISFTGVDQTIGLASGNAVSNNAVGAATTITASVPTASSDAVVSLFGSNDGSPTTNQTLWASAALTTFGTNYWCANYEIGATSPAAMTLTQSSSAIGHYNALRIVAGGGAAPPAAQARVMIMA